MTVDLARTMRARWGWAAIALVVVAFVLDALPIDDYFPLSALAAVGFALARRSFHGGWIACHEDGKGDTTTPALAPTPR